MPLATLESNLDKREVDRLMFAAKIERIDKRFVVLETVGAEIGAMLMKSMAGRSKKSNVIDIPCS